MEKDLKKIQKKYLSAIKELKKNNKLYYDKSDPKVTDSEYDNLKTEIVELENKYRFLKSNVYPSNSVGFSHFGFSDAKKFSNSLAIYNSILSNRH